MLIIMDKYHYYYIVDIVIINYVSNNGLNIKHYVHYVSKGIIKVNKEKEKEMREIKMIKNMMMDKMRWLHKHNINIINKIIVIAKVTVRVRVIAIVYVKVQLNINNHNNNNINNIKEDKY